MLRLRSGDQGRARHVPVSRATHGDSRSVTEQPAVLLSCAAAGPPVAVTSFASRGSEPEQDICISPQRARTGIPRRPLGRSPDGVPWCGIAMASGPR
jgi:hypothetical protein